jgi:hypothetical protein
MTKAKSTKPKAKPGTRESPSITPDSIAKRDQTLPDDLRRRVREEIPDSLPAAREESTLAPDGGAADHPIHDEPLEDMKPEDFEAQIDDAEKAKLERYTDDETVDPRTTREFSAGSSDPRDQKTQKPLPVRHD